MALVRNESRARLGLDARVSIPAGVEMEVDDKLLESVLATTVGKAWIEDKALVVVKAPAKEKAPAKAPFVKG